MNDDKRLTVPGGGAIRAVDPREFPDLEQAQVGISVDPKYKEFREGEVMRCIFCGFTFIKGDLKAAVLQTKDGFFLNAGVTLVQQLGNIPAGSPVQIEFKGKRAVKDGGEGARANIFQVNLLNAGPVVTQSVTVPSPSSAPQTDLKQETKKATLYSRPLGPETLRDLLNQKVAKHATKGTIATQADRGILAVVLKTTFNGDEEKRRVLTGYLLGKEHIKDMNQAEVMTLLDWLDCHSFDSAPPQFAIDEARAAYQKALEVANETNS